MPTLKKLTPLIIFVIFIVAGYFIIQGMERAVDMTKEKHIIKK